MIPLKPLFFAMAAGASCLGCFGQESAPADDRIWNPQVFRSGENGNSEVDTKKIIKDSNNFLKEREPEMNSEEYALYQKVVTVLNGNPEFAIKLLEAMMNEKEPPSPAFEFMLGNAYYTAGQNDKAELRYRSAVSRFPTFLRAWNNLGVLYYTSERYSNAVSCFGKSITLGDRDATTYGLLGYSLEKTGNVISAELAYMQALNSDPVNSHWLEGLMRLYMDSQQYSRAEPLVKNLIKDHPTETQYWMAYAHILLSEHRTLKAIALLEVATQAKIGGTDELALLGDLYAEQNLIPEAAATYEKLTVLQPQQGERKRLQFAQVLVAADRLNEAADVLNRLKGDLSPEGRLALLQISADLLSAQKHWPQARSELETLLKLTPLNGRALLGLGKAYVAENDLPRASFAFEAAYRIPAATYRASLELADIELKNRHYRKASEYLEKAYSIDKTDAAAELLARLKPLVSREN